MYIYTSDIAYMMTGYAYKSIPDRNKGVSPSCHRLQESDEQMERKWHSRSAHKLMAFGAAEQSKDFWSLKSKRAKTEEGSSRGLTMVEKGLLDVALSRGPCTSTLVGAPNKRTGESMEAWTVNRHDEWMLYCVERRTKA